MSAFQMAGTLVQLLSQGSSEKQMRKYGHMSHQLYMVIHKLH